MADHIVKILDTKHVTHNVKQFALEKPANYKFIPGQATDVSINQPQWKEELRPFTFTSLNDENHLQFTIKIYTDHNGVTNALGKLKAGDELIIRDVWGAINYNGPGVFIAGGAGITPFIAILRQLYKDKKMDDNKLIFSNKTTADIILKDELELMLGDNFIKVLTREGNGKRIDKEFLKKNIRNFNQQFYLCGPEKFVESIRTLLIELGASVDAVVIEK